MRNKIMMLDDESGEITIHVQGVISDYATLCGIAADGDGNSQIVISKKPDDKVDCSQCKLIYEACSSFRKSDFKD